MAGGVDHGAGRGRRVAVDEVSEAAISRVMAPFNRLMIAPLALKAASEGRSVPNPPFG